MTKTASTCPFCGDKDPECTWVPDDTAKPCGHGRDDYRTCPHCLGVGSCSPAINTASGRAYETCETLEEAVEWYVGDIGAQPVDREEAAFRAGAHWASAKRDEVSRESINQLAGELDECREDVARLKEEYETSVGAGMHNAEQFTKWMDEKNAENARLEDENTRLRDGTTCGYCDFDSKIEVRLNEFQTELDLRLKQIADLKHELEARMETEKRLRGLLREWYEDEYDGHDLLIRTGEALSLKARGG